MLQYLSLSLLPGRPGGFAASSRQPMPLLPFPAVVVLPDPANYMERQNTMRTQGENVP